MLHYFYTYSQYVVNLNKTIELSNLTQENVLNFIQI